MQLETPHAQLEFTIFRLYIPTCCVCLSTRCTSWRCVASVVAWIASSGVFSTHYTFIVLTRALYTSTGKRVVFQGSSDMYVAHVTRPHDITM